MKSPSPAAAAVDTHASISEASLRRLVDGFPLPVIIVAIDPPQRIEFLNEQAVRTLGYVVADIPTVQAWAERAYPDPKYRKEAFVQWDAAVERARRETGRVEAMAYRIRCADGLTREMLLSATVLEHRLVVAATDLTERRRAEAELAQARERLEKIAYELTEHIPAGTYTMVMRPGTQVAQFSFMSRRFLEMVGFTRAEAEANPFGVFDCVHPDDRERWIRKNLEVFATKSPFSGQTRVLVTGNLRWYSAESIPRDLPDGSTVWEGVLVDITAQKTAEAALQRTHEELLTAERERSRQEERRRLLQDMHDGFGSQLASARLQLLHGTITQDGIAELLQACLDDLHLVGDTLNNADKSLADALADFRFRLDALVAGAPMALSWHLELEHAPALPERTILQVLRITQEAVNNAIKHSRASRIQICAGHDAPRGVWVHVSDDGVGMPDQPAHGRGLANMRGRARELGARLQWHALARGTRVALELPDIGRGPVSER